MGTVYSTCLTVRWGFAGGRHFAWGPQQCGRGQGRKSTVALSH